MIRWHFEASSLLRQVEQTRQRYGRSFDTAMRAAHHEMGSVVQRGMAEELNRQVKALGRPQTHRTGRDAHGAGTLEKVLLDEGNRSVTYGGVRVGVLAHLNRSEAKRYWRGIEEGIGSYYAQGWFFDSDGGAPQFAPPRPAYRRMHGRFPQSRTAATRLSMIRVAAFEGHHYSRGGAAAFRRLDKLALYRKYLGPLGIRISGQGRLSAP